MIARLLIGIAKWVHKAFPFCELRTANLILKINGQKDLRVGCKLFNYKIYLNAHRSTVHILLCIQGEKFIDDVMFLEPHLKQGMTAFDVGANLGYLTYFLCSKIGPTGRVFSFEPDPDNWRELSENIRSNNIAFCQPMHTAVGSFDGMIPFLYGHNGHVDTDPGGKPNSAIVALDSFVRKHSIAGVDLIKVDVEGFELDVLTGLSQILSEKIKPILFVEVHPLGFGGKGDPAEVCSFLERYYSNICAFRAPSDVRTGLSPWGKLFFQFGSDESVRRRCEVSLKEVKENQLMRVYLLCLPEI